MSSSGTREEKRGEESGPSETSAGAARRAGAAHIFYDSEIVCLVNPSVSGTEAISKSALHILKHKKNKAVR